MSDSTKKSTKHIVLKSALIITGVFFGLSGVAFAKPDFKKALGVGDCKECHVPGKFKEPSDKPLYVKAKEMVASMKKGEGDFAGKTSCNECHQGKLKP